MQAIPILEIQPLQDIISQHLWDVEIPVQIMTASNFLEKHYLNIYT